MVIARFFFIWLRSLAPLLIFLTRQARLPGKRGLLGKVGPRNTKVGPFEATDRTFYGCLRSCPDVLHAWRVC